MIGIFDSGSGGLTVLCAIRERLSSPDIIYFGDIKNAPYGAKSHDELSQLTVAAISLLRKEGARSIVSACNSVSASLAISLFDALDIAPTHLIEMVGPTVAFFKNSQKRVAIAATPATIKSGVYRLGFKMIGKDVVEVPIPELAGLIEFGANEAEMEEKIRTAFKNIDADFEVLILACTHYPLIPSVFRRIFPDKIILDPAEVVAERVERELWPLEAGNGTTRFLISKDSAHFRKFVAELLSQRTYTIEVV